MNLHNSNQPNAITRDVVYAAYQIRYASLPGGLRKKIRYLFVDGIGVWLAGMRHPNVSILVDYLRDSKSGSVTPLTGHQLSVSLTDAAWVNGVATHVLDYEPMFDPPTHAVSPVIGALLALWLADESALSGNTIPLDGDLLLSVFTAGIQIQADLRKASSINDHIANEHAQFFPFQKQGFHPPGIVGVMGSALASAIYLGLDQQKACMALGMAASRAGGIAANIGTMTKASHSGNAARAGLESALLVKKGFTASVSTFEEPGGWGDVFGGNSFSHATLIEGMQKLSSFDTPGFAFKFWPAHTAMQVAIHAALPLHDPMHPYTGDIYIEAPVFKYCDRPHPNSADACRFSFQYNVVLALLDGEINEDSYTEQQRSRRDVQELLQKVTLNMSSDIPAHFPKMQVNVRLSDGRSSGSDRWPGHWKMPVTEEQLKYKFMACVEPLLGPDKAVLILDSLLTDTKPVDMYRIKKLLI